MKILHDITPPVSERLAVWPGDTPMSREVLMDMKDGAHLTLSTMHATCHLGAHVDGANHYGRDAASIDACDLERFLGPCQVIHAASPRGTRLGPEHCPKTLRAKRVLFATGSYPDPEAWNGDFCGLEPDLVDALADAGVELVGIDTPSVDLSDSKDLPAHRRVLAREMSILEGIVLADVPEGVYELIALPLRLVGFDASPVCAVLCEA